MDTNDLLKMRDYLKANPWTTLDFSQSDQSKGVAAPSIEKPPRADQKLIALPTFDRETLRTSELLP